MYTVHCDSSIETTVYRTTLHIATINIALHVEVDWVAAETERLTRVGDLNMVEMCNSQSLVFHIWMNHYLDPKLVASSLVPVAPLETCLRLKLVRIELLWTCFDLAIPSLVEWASYDNITGKQANLWFE